MAEGRAVNPLLILGVTAAAVVTGWWLLGRRTAAGGGGEGGIITQAQAQSFALSWALSYESSSGLTLISQTRIVFFIGKPPRMSLSDWELVGGTPTRAFYYVEFSYVGNEFLTVMIDAITGEKPPVSQGWVAGTLSHNFGL